MPGRLPTRDANLFNLKAGYERIWVQRDDARSVREKKTVSSVTAILTAFRFPKEFALIEAFPKG
jgi:hypothetical protein